MIPTPFGAHRFRGEPRPLSSSPAYLRVSFHMPQNQQTSKPAAQKEAVPVTTKTQSMKTPSATV